MNQPDKRPPEKLPDPWLFDSESLLRELDRCRELVLAIPATTHAVHFASNIAIDAIWNLRETLRELLRIHRDGQSNWTQKHQALQRDLTQRPIEGAAGMAKKRELRELKQRIFNLQDQLTTLEHQFAQDSTAQPKPAEAKIVQIRA
jgi:predicted RNA-binding Zn ribbon-like protein